jgi:hypothetical protein
MRIILYLEFFHLAGPFFPGYTGYRGVRSGKTVEYQHVAALKSVTGTGYNRLHRLQQGRSHQVDATDHKAARKAETPNHLIMPRLFSARGGFIRLAAIQEYEPTERRMCEHEHED